MAELIFKKVRAGHYESTDGRYAVKHDGYPVSNSIGADGFGYEGFVGGEWASVVDPHGRDENLDWFKTKREAVADCEEYERRVVAGTKEYGQP